MNKRQDRFLHSSGRKPLYILPKEGMILGVCAGIAHRFEIQVAIVRVAFLALMFVSLGLVVILYLGLGLCLPALSSKMLAFYSIQNNITNLSIRIHNVQHRIDLLESKFRQTHTD